MAKHFICNGLKQPHPNINPQHTEGLQPLSPAVGVQAQSSGLGTGWPLGYKRTGHYNRTSKHCLPLAAPQQVSEARSRHLEVDSTHTVVYASPGSDGKQATLGEATVVGLW
ncbi:unnamed protein product [Arctogadus glacialis]